MEIVVPRCSRSMAIVVLALRARTTMAIERLHLGTTISIERRHSVIIMFHYRTPNYSRILTFRPTITELIKKRVFPQQIRQSDITEHPIIVVLTFRPTKRQL